MSKILKYWSILIPILAIIGYFTNLFETNLIGQIIVTLLLIGSILSAVHHSEEIAHKVGEPFGTIILAISITIIEVALIISLMLVGGEKTIYLARDTVFSSIMILLTIIAGLCILLGSIKHFEQTFEKKSVNTALVSLVAIIVLTLILPNFTTSGEIGSLTNVQILFISSVCFIIYGTFIYVQTVRHRNFFISENAKNKSLIETTEHKDIETHQEFSIFVHLIALIVSLTIVVLLAKTISPTIEAFIINAGLPHALLGIIIASVILLPEGIAAVKAAYRDDFQTSLNLTLGSALAAIGLTIPSVAIVSTAFNIDIKLGLESMSMLILGLTIFTIMLSLSKGRTNILYGVILIILFLTFVFTTIKP